MESIIIGVIIAIIVAAIVVGIMKGQMRPVAQKHEATNYTTESDLKLTAQDDVFVRKDVTKVPIQSAQSANSQLTPTAGGGNGRR